jgi:outer membrane biosynthesis protein TonB
MKTVDRRLWVALAVSLIGHVLVAAFAPVDPPETDPNEKPLTARLTAMPAPPVPQAAAPVPTAQPKAKPKPKRVAPPPPPGTAVAALPANEPLLEPAAPAPAEPVAEKAPEPETPKPEEKVAQAPKPEPVPELPTPTSTASASGYTEGELNAMTTKEKSKGEKQLEALPRMIDLNYKAGYAQGENYPMPVGAFKLRFEHAGGKYELRTTGQASGFFRFMYPGVLRMKSVGKLSERGLEPDYFEMNRERQGQDARVRKVEFDREAKLIRLNDKPPVPIEGPVFDVLTFIVQFYFAVPDTDEVTLQVVSPTRVDAYTLKRTGKETLDTSQGKIETEVWKGSRKSTAGEAEFWLAPSWHYIPFKVRMTDEKERKASFELESVAVEAKPAS